MNNSLLRLIRSFSRAEKRQFQLSMKKSDKQYAYYDLYHLISRDSRIELDDLKKAFKKKYPTVSYESTANYLYKLAIDSLIQNKIKNDETYSLLYGLLKIKIMQERNLEMNAYFEIKKNEAIAEVYHQLPIQYILKRMELDYLSKANFPGITEKELFSKQVNAKDVLREIRSIQEHHTLYELLKYRLNNTDEILSEKTKSELNDLVLSEIAIINTNTKQTPESKRLHLLFQSFFFIKTGNFKSALRTFYILNDLYENQLIERQHPPIDYFSMLDGIFDSLTKTGLYKDMDYFLKKLELLDKPIYPEYFRILVRKTSFLAKLRSLCFEKNWKEALKLIMKSDSETLEHNTFLELKKQIEISFFISLIFFMNGNQNKAVKNINRIILMKTVDYSSLIYRVSRLFNIVMYYENRDMEYLEYEIRSYKRIFKGKIKMFLIEKLIFKVIKSDPKLRSRNANKFAYEKIIPLKNSIMKNEYESQILKYFDFVNWGEKQYQLR